MDRPLAVLIPTSSGRDRRRDATVHETVDDVCGTRRPSQEHPQRARDRLGTDTPPPARPGSESPEELGDLLHDRRLHVVAVVEEAVNRPTKSWSASCSSARSSAHCSVSGHATGPLRETNQRRLGQRSDRHVVRGPFLETAPSLVVDLGRGHVPVAEQLPLTLMMSTPASSKSVAVVALSECGV